MNQDELIERWRNATTWAAKSHIEQMLIEAGSSTVKLRKLLPNVKQQSIGIRGMIRSLKNDAIIQEIFELLDKKLNPRIVMHAIRAAKATAQSKSDIARLTLSYVRKLLAREISVMYIKKLAQTRSRTKPFSRAPRAPHAPKPGHWRSVDELISALIELNATEGDEPTRASARAAIKLALEEYRRRVARAREHQEQSQRATRAHEDTLTAACRVLGLVKPRDGKPVDAEQLRVKKRALARVYHPDATGTNDTADQFAAVMHAADVIERYNQRCSA